MATYATNVQCIGALKYKATLGAITKETGRKMDKCVIAAVRAKSRQCRQVHGDIVFMKTKEGGYGAQMSTAVRQAATANTMYWSLNSLNKNCTDSTTEAIWECWQQREDNSTDVINEFPPYFVQGMEAVEKAGMHIKISHKTAPTILEWTLTTLINDSMRGRTSEYHKENTRRTVLKRVQELQTRCGRTMKVIDILKEDTEAIHIWQAMWMKSRITGNKTEHAKGIVDTEILKRLGTTDEHIETLTEAIEACLANAVSGQEAWANLNMNGDELTEHLVKAQRQRTYGNNTHNTIGCDGGLKATCLYDGTKGRPRADWCVSDGITHTWVLGKLEGEPNICDAEFMAKTVATMICADKPDKTIIFDSKSSGMRYAQATTMAKDISKGQRTTTKLHRQEGRTVIRSCANQILKRVHEIHTRWTKSHKKKLETPDAYTNDTAQTKGAHTAETRGQRQYRAYEVDATHSSCHKKDMDIHQSAYNAVLESATKAALKGVSVNRWLVHQEQIWPVTVASLQSKSRNSKADFMIKVTAKALPTSTLLRHKYGPSIIDDITCSLYAVEKTTHRNTYSADAHAPKRLAHKYTNGSCTWSPETRK
jgi:hypothetical protein